MGRTAFTIQCLTPVTHPHLSQLIGYFAGWSTIVTTTSIVLAFFVSVAIGLVFGLDPARAGGEPRSRRGAAL